MLKSLAKHFITRDISNYCFVFPNRRAGLFFREYLKEVATKTFITPAITTIEEIFQQYSKLKSADQLTLIFNLYKAYTNVMSANGKKAEDFEDFIPFGQTLIGDFNDIDNYLIDTSKLLQNIDELQQMDSSDEYLNDEQIKVLKELFNYSEKEHIRKFKSTWNLLLPIYQEFKKILSEQGLAYPGMLCRSVIEESNGNIDTDFDKIVFVGFNALDNVEKALFKSLGTKADFYWDYNIKPYNEDPDNLANFFKNDNLSRFNSKEKVDYEPLPQTTHFYNIVTSSMTAQTIEAQKIIRKLNANSTDTAIVLLDENMLLPMLMALPLQKDDAGRINVTMGYPISHTTVVEFIENYFLLQNSAVETSGEVEFYHKHVLSILSHPYIQHLCTSADNIADVIDNILRNNQIMVPTSAISEKLSSINIVSEVFKKVKVDELLQQTTKILKLVKPDNEYEEKCIEQVLLSIGKINKLLDEFLIDSQLSPIRMLQIIKQSISGVSVSFKGEPLSGLQIMGTLETRCLSFKNILFLSFNEGVFPKSGKTNSIIPYNIRKGYGLPTTEHQDAVYAYNFYRLVAHAENVYLISDSRTDNMRSGEPSRYLNQLKYIYNANITNKVVAGDIKIEKENSEIQKPADFAQKLLNGTIKLSPSSLNTYCSCPFRFYLQQYLGISESNEVTEIMEESDFGSVFHRAMEILYTDLKNDYGGGEFTAEMLKNLKSTPHKVDDAITKAFNEVYFHNMTAPYKELNGVNYLNAQVIKHYVNSTLAEDIRIAPFSLKHCEYKCEVQYINKNNTLFANKSITIKGSIDRIDAFTHPDDKKLHLRLLDYKTGKVKCSFRPDNPRNDDGAAARQLFLYRYMVENDKTFKEPFNAVDLRIYGVGSLGKPGGETDKGLTDEKYEEFLPILDNILSEMINPEEPIKKDYGKCTYCPLTDICKRI